MRSCVGLRTCGNDLRVWPLISFSELAECLDAQLPSSIRAGVETDYSSEAIYGRIHLKRRELNGQRNAATTLMSNTLLKDLAMKYAYLNFKRTLHYVSAINIYISFQSICDGLDDKPQDQDQVIYAPTVADCVHSMSVTSSVGTYS